MNRKTTLLLTSLLVLFALACNVTFTFDSPTPSLPPTAAPPTVTAVPLSAQVTLVSQPYIETNQEPPFTITAQTPQLSGSDDPRVLAFNQRLAEVVQKEVASFRESFLQNINPPISAGGSFLEVTYTLLHQFEEVWSLKFDFSFYSDGAAHPGGYSRTLNYDLARSRELTLADLFLPNSAYLQVISAYCTAELSKQPFFEGPFTAGASPLPENYRNWNITSEGLLVTFDEYQVAPYAAGPQQVLVPYSALTDIIDPQGPLGSLMR